MIGVLGAAVLAAQTPAAAQDWWYFSVSGDIGDQQAFYIDLLSFRRVGDLVEVDQAREGEQADDQAILGSRLHIRYDCRARTSQVLRYRFMLADGGSYVADRAQDRPEPVGAGSVSEQGLLIACGEAQGIEQLDDLRVREQALLLFAERAEYLRANPDAPR